ncbi:MAG: hypothetical protein U5R48_13240 [Gammaproteobacteria bacterium]|nr:hypothetical protein [Gammaproteobacteria bacterium]
MHQKQPARVRSGGLPEAIVEDLLVGALGVRYLMVGDDFRFGHNREGDFALLEAAGMRHGFAVDRLDTLALAQERVSSIRVRMALAAGDLLLAERLPGSSLLHYRTRGSWSPDDHHLPAQDPQRVEVRVH